MSDIVSQLKAIKLYGMADSYAELQSHGTAAISAWHDSPLRCTIDQHPPLLI